MGEKNAAEVVSLTSSEHFPVCRPDAFPNAKPTASK